jgi:hypothetical protein
MDQTEQKDQMSRHAISRCKMMSKNALFRMRPRYHRHRRREIKIK